MASGLKQKLGDVTDKQDELERDFNTMNGELNTNKLRIVTLKHAPLRLTRFALLQGR